MSKPHGYNLLRHFITITLCLLFFVVFIIFVFSHKVYAAAGDSTTLSASGDRGKMSNMVMKNDGTPFIVYMDTTNTDIRSFNCTNAACTTGTDSLVYNGSPQDQLAVVWRSSNLPIIFYRDQGDNSFRALDCTNITCTTFTARILVAGVGTAALGAQISAVRKNDGFAIATYVNNAVGTLNTVSCTNALCSTFTTTLSIDTNAGHPTIRIDPTDGNPIIIYQKTNSSIRRVACSNTACSASTQATLYTSPTGAAVYPHIDKSFEYNSSNLPVIFYWVTPDPDNTSNNYRVKAIACNDSKCNTYNWLPDVFGTEMGSDYSTVKDTTGQIGLIGHTTYGSFVPAQRRFRYLTCLNSGCTSTNVLNFNFAPWPEDRLDVIMRSDTNLPLISYYVGSALDLATFTNFRFQIMSLSSTLDATNASDVSLEEDTNNGSTNSAEVIRLKKNSGSLRIADVTTNMTTDRYWNTVSADTDTVTKKTYVQNLSTAPGAAATFDFYVPKGASDLVVHICPNATNFAQITIFCTSGVGYTATSPGVTVVNISGQDYWKISNFSGGGGMSSSGFFIINLSASLDATNATNDVSLEPAGTGVVNATQAVRVKTSGGLMISQITVDMTYYRSWPSVIGDVDMTSGRSYVTNLTSAPGAAATHSLYIPKLPGKGAVWICPSATSLNDVFIGCPGGYAVRSPAVATINSQDYFRVDGLSGTGGIGISNITSVAFTLSPNTSAINVTQQVNITYTPPAEFSAGDQIAIDFDTGGSFVLANTCTTPTTDADGNGTGDGSAVVQTNGGLNADRYLYTFTGPTVQATTNGIHLCVKVTAPGVAGNYKVDMADSKGNFGAQFYYVGNENQLNVLGTVDLVLTVQLRNASDTGPLANVNGAAVGPNLCDLGNLSNAGIQSCSYRLKVSSNAPLGYVVNIQTDGDLRKGTDAIDNIIEDSTNVTAGVESYGIALNAGSATGGSVIEAGIFADDDSPLGSGTNTTLYSTTGPNNPTTTDTTNTALITHKADASAATPAGKYTQLVTYTVSASY